MSRHESGDVKTAVRRRYAALARDLAAGQAGCCGSGCAESTGVGTVDGTPTESIPSPVAESSLGCGNPTALADLSAGDIVLDLGSGAGLDVFLAAQRVGDTGRVYGLDLTDEMLDLARSNQRLVQAANVEFMKGDIEDIPLPDASVDVIISNCVINLAADKRRALSEAFRVLRPGGRFAVSDVISSGPIPERIRHDMELWVGCVAGALDMEVFRGLLVEIGFRDVEIEPTAVYPLPSGIAEGTTDPAMGRFASASIRGRKPAS